MPGTGVPPTQVERAAPRVSPTDGNGAPAPALLHGVGASRLQLPDGGWDTVLACLCDRFPRIAAGQWLDRMRRGRVTDAQGTPLAPGHPYRRGLEVRYFREVADEPAIPFHEVVLHEDAELLVVDKPHFLPVVPAGRYVEHTLLSRLQRQRGNPDLVPLHRLDRATAGLVMFSVRRQTRDAYQALFRERRIDKEYLAIAPALPALQFPLQRCSRLERGLPFFRMAEVAGVPNAETAIDVERGDGPSWHYVLRPRTGRKHQLRLHMAALGAGIRGDAWYPTLQANPMGAGDAAYAAPLQLLARRVAFIDPLTGVARRFDSVRSLAWP